MKTSIVLTTNLPVGAPGARSSATPPISPVAHHPRAIPLPNLLAFSVAAAAVLIAIPGPSVLFVIGPSLSPGWRGGVPSAIGNTTGVLVQLALVVVGAGASVAQ